MSKVNRNEVNKNAQNATISPTTGLTPQQEQACILLASGENVTNVADKLSLNRGTLGSSRISGAWIFRKVLNLQHENCRCNMDVPSRWLERTVRDSPVRTN